MIRVVLVEDQLLVRRGLKALLELCPEIQIVADASDARGGAACVREHRPEVLLLDVRMPGASGIDMLRELQLTGELPATILLTTFDDDAALLEGIRHGARGYLLKDVSLEQLIDAIRAVAEGKTLIRPVVTERILRGLEQLRANAPSAAMPVEPITQRELDVLRLMAGGYSNREIAEALSTVEGTVKNHVSSILAKLCVRDRTRAVLKAIELGVI